MPGYRQIFVRKRGPSLASTSTLKLLWEIMKNFLLENSRYTYNLGIMYIGTCGADALRKPSTLFGVDCWTHTHMPLEKNASHQGKKSMDICTGEKESVFSMNCGSTKNLVELNTVWDWYGIDTSSVNIKADILPKATIQTCKYSSRELRTFYLYFIVFWPISHRVYPLQNRCLIIRDGIPPKILLWTERIT